MSVFSEILNSSAEFAAAIDNIESQKCPIHITGITGSQKSHLIYSLCSKLNKKCLVITSDEQEAGRIKSDLSFLFRDEIALFKNKEYVFYDIDASNHSSEIMRLNALSKIADGSSAVTTIDAVSKFTIPPKVFNKHFKIIKPGDIVDIEAFTAELTEMGYQKCSVTEGMGQFSVRGSIIDVFSPCHSNPVRIDLFDDEVDSLREYDSSTQVSVENIETVRICPVREVIYTFDKALEAAAEIRKLKNENLYSDAEKLENSVKFASLDKYMPYFYERVYTVLDYIDNDTLVFLDEAKQLSEISKVSYKEHSETVADLLSKGILPRHRKNYMADYYDLISSVEETSIVSLSSLSHLCPVFTPRSFVGITAKSLNGYTGKTNFLVEDLKFWKNNCYRILIVLNGKTKVDAVASSLLDNDIEAAVASSDSLLPQPGQIYLIDGCISKGFEYPDIKTVVVTDGETTPVYKKKENQKVK